jgi:serine/threonine protein kinase/Tfp pilus assembly protein PilF
MTAIEDQARSIFLAALERAPNEWPAFLEQACGDKADLRARVDQLMQAHEALGSIHCGACAPTSTIDEALREAPGAVIGPYKLMEQIGEGGMGLVFVAEQQQPVRRKVAVKVIKPGMDTRQVVARFEAERQALALMDHPNIAKVLDGGETASGRPYFVMELVRGVPITEYCDENQVPVRDRLELFLQVCQAVQHAHQKGIIHRDIKPSNVLITSRDGTPVPKVIDFGVAKAVGQQLTDKTIYTQFTQLVGTPLYMSPEQAGQSSLDVDTRTDIYALGVLLYELLTGTTPFVKERFKEVGYDEIRRIIREEEPPKPSTRISTLGKAATTHSTRRKSDPKRLSQLFRGELDWIVMKALEKDRTRRYESAGAFAADVLRYLNDEPVLACPPSLGYRLRKFVRRNKGPVLAASVILLSLIAGIGGTTIGLVRSISERDQKEEARREAVAHAEAEAEARRLTRRALNTMTDEVIEDLLGKQVELTDQHRKFLEKVLALHAEFTAGDADDPESRYSRAEGYYHVGRIRRTLGESADADKACRASIAILRDLVAEHKDRDDFRHSLLHSCHELARILTEGTLVGGKTQRKKEIADVFREAVDHANVLANNSQNAEYRFDLASNEHCLAAELLYSGQALEAEPLLRHALIIANQLADEFPESVHYRAGVASSYGMLATVLSSTNRPEEATEAYRAARDNYFKLMALYRGNSKYSEDQAVNNSCLGDIHQALGELKEAKDAFRRSVTIGKQLAKEFPSRPIIRHALGTTESNLGMLLLKQDDLKGAEESFQDCMELYQTLTVELPLNPDLRWFLSGAYRNLAVIMDKTNRPKETESYWRDSIRECQKLVDKFPKHDEYRLLLARGCDELAHFLYGKGRHQEAESYWRKALKHYMPGAGELETVYCRYNFSVVLGKLGQIEMADREYTEAFQDTKDPASAHFEIANALCPHRPDDAIAEYRVALRLKEDFPGAHFNLGNALQDKGLYDDAMVEFRAALATKQDSPEAYKAHTGLGIALGAKGRPDDAITAFQEALQINPEYAVAHFGLGIALADKGLLDKAIAEYRLAIHFDKDYAPAHVNLGNALQDKGLLDDAIAEYRAAIESKQAFPKAYKAHLSLGNALLEKGERDEAIKAFREAIRINPECAEAHYGLGNAFFPKQLDDAIVEFREAIRCTNDFPEAHVNLGNALVEKELLDDALAEFGAAIATKQVFPEAYKAYSEMGIVLLRKGRPDDAIPAFRQAIRINPKYARAHYFLGNAFFPKRLDDAIFEFGEAIRLKEDFAEAHCNLGHALKRKGEFRQALEEYRRGDKLGFKIRGWPYPSDEWVRQCERLIDLDGRFAGFRAGMTKPANPAERIELAGLCSVKRLHRAASRFYDEAFAEDPELISPNRYNAACAAAQVGCGEGKDADKVDENERRRLRRQALDWLRADLEVNRLLLEKVGIKAGPTVAGSMRHWLDDPDFAGVRGTEAIAKLPEAERKPWEKLWKDVADLLMRAEGKIETR